MKPFIALTAAAAVLSIVACGPSAEEIAQAKEKAMQDSIAKAAGMERTYAVDAATSTVRWQGNMTGLKSYSHFGHVTLNNGSFTVKGGQLTGGTFEINMKSIAPADSNYTPDHSKEMLVGHLSTGEFFAVDSFPTATFKITSVNGNTATGELTVRGKTSTETITDLAVAQADNMATATGKMTFDRQKYGVSWKAMKDMLLADNIEMSIELKGNAQ